MFRRPVATRRVPQSLVLGMFRLYGIIEPKIGPNMSVTALLAPVGTSSSGPPQKFGHGPSSVGQLLSRNQVSQQFR